MFPTFTPAELEQRWSQLTQDSQRASWRKEVLKRNANVKVLLAACKELFAKDPGANKGYIAVTASTFFQYFRTLDPDYGGSAWALATAALLLASKLYNTNKSIVEITKLSLKHRCTKDPTYKGKEHLIEQDPGWVDYHLGLVRSCEADLLVGIDFDLDYKNPHMLLVCKAKEIGMCPGLDIHASLRTPARATPRVPGGSSSAGAARRSASGKQQDVISEEEKAVLQYAINLINDSAASTMPLEFTSAELANGALFVAVEQHRHRPKLPKPTSLLASFDMPSKRLETLVLRFRSLYQNKEMVCMDVPALVAADVAIATGQQQQVKEQAPGAVSSPAHPAADVKASPGGPSGVSSKTTADPPAGEAANGAAAAGPGSPVSVGRGSSPCTAAAPAVVHGASSGAAATGNGSLLPGTLATNGAHCPSGSSPARGKRKRASEEGEAGGFQQHPAEAGPGESQPKRQGWAFSGW